VILTGRTDENKRVIVPSPYPLQLPHLTDHIHHDNIMSLVHHNNLIHRIIGDDEEALRQYDQIKQSQSMPSMNACEQSLSYVHDSYHDYSNQYMLVFIVKANTPTLRGIPIATWNQTDYMKSNIWNKSFS
jgi:hypothetical protein